MIYHSKEREGKREREEDIERGQRRVGKRERELNSLLLIVEVNSIQMQANKYRTDLSFLHYLIIIIQGFHQRHVRHRSHKTLRHVPSPSIQFTLSGPH